MTQLKIENQEFNIYVGMTRPQLLSFYVLKYSIDVTASQNVNVIQLNEKIESNKVAKGTPFSLQRIFIPFLNNYKNVALYLDSDMIVFSDIIELFKLKNKDEIVSACDSMEGSLRPKQFSVFLIDCSKATYWPKNIDELQDHHNTCLEFEVSKSNSLTYEWNSLEYYAENKTKLLHYTDMATQPWLSSSNKLDYLWYDFLERAINDKVISKEFIINEIKQGYIKPSLKRFTEVKIRNATIIEKLLDSIYSPPHTVARFFKTNNKLTRHIVGIAMLIRSIF